MAKQHYCELRNDKTRPKLGKEKRKIQLFVDNYSAHNNFPKLVNIELLFIMAGATTFIIFLENYRVRT